MVGGIEMENKQEYRVLLYYNFVPIDDPVTSSEEHLAFCQDLGLKGRILVAEEGLNGTVSGTVEQTEKYMRSEEHTSELQSRFDLVCRLLLEKKKYSALINIVLQR